jgi:hypothetical protein
MLKPEAMSIGCRLEVQGAWSDETGPANLYVYSQMFSNTKTVLSKSNVEACVISSNSSDCLR